MMSYMISYVYDFICARAFAGSFPLASDAYEFSLIPDVEQPAFTVCG